MKIKFDKEFNEKLEGKLSETASKELKDLRIWGSSVEIDFKYFTDEDLDTLVAIAEQEGNRSVKLQVNSYRNVVNNTDSAKIKNLQLLEEGLRAYFDKDAIRHWVYVDKGEVLPYLITGIRYDEGRNSDDPATITIYGTANGMKSLVRKSVIATFYSDVIGKTIPEILASKGLSKETEELINQSVEDAKLCLTYRKMLYKEFIANGEGRTGEWRYYDIKFENTRCVNDEQNISRDMQLTSTDHCWGEEPLKVPVHPYVHVFSLQHHQYMNILAKNMKPYVYDDSLKDKLVLPDTHSDLLDILTNDENILAGDIIKGKSGGTTILCCGAPGLGKTLTAECYSEITHKPLYKVNSGQLGTCASKVEENLEVILKRASRWGAVMLIDEADTYVRKRGYDIEQNAVVAAFLRTLEYFDGLLFMTTNRFEEVDDAIVSRCIATITYEVPSNKSKKRIWKVLSEEFKMDLDESLIDDLVRMFPGVTGRDIKELLKLTGRYIKSKNISSRSGKIKAFISCSQFRAIEIDFEEIKILNQKGMIDEWKE